MCSSLSGISCLEVLKMCKLFWGVELESLALSIKFMGLYGTILLLFALIIVGDLQGWSLHSSYVNTDIYFLPLFLKVTAWNKTDYTTKRQDVVINIDKSKGLHYLCHFQIKIYLMTKCRTIRKWWSWNLNLWLFKSSLQVVWDGN